MSKRINETLCLFCAFYFIDKNKNNNKKQPSHAFFSWTSYKLSYLISVEEGRRLFKEGKYQQASNHFWQAILFHADSKAQSVQQQQQQQQSYTVQDAFEPFLECYQRTSSILDAYLFIAKESIQRVQLDIAQVYIDQVLKVDSMNEQALNLLSILEQKLPLRNSSNKEKKSKRKSHPNNNSMNKVEKDEEKQQLRIQKATELYNLGTKHFDTKNFIAAAKAFDESCTLANGNINFGGACTNAIYCRSNVMDWGYNGTTFRKDMETIERITKMEVELFRSVNNNKGNGSIIHWTRATSVHPHMMLGYPLQDSMLKRYVSESYALLDEPHARYKNGHLPDLPPDLPFDHSLSRSISSSSNKSSNSSKIKVGFISSGFKSQAVLYLSYTMFQFFNKDQFEIHVYSVGAADNPLFIQNAMRGVDWRERVKVNVHKFHDVQKFKDDHIALARKINNDNIHILIEWDGYARQGLRAQGVFALRPAPIQILHQEFLGTTGGQYVDYIITDEVTSPRHLEHLYVEKFIYMPNHFFSKGHAIQSEVKQPTYEYKPKEIPYKLGTGMPQENKCLAGADVGDDVSFVYCNFNKFLKLNPETVNSWIDILRKVPNSILCLLENPPSGIPFLRQYVHDVSSSSSEYNDGDELNSRIHFLKWQANPFDHQIRSQDFCNVVLDSHPYNGHTTGVDALYGGVPIITRQDGDDMASRVTTSANHVLGLEELNANDSSHLVDIAVKVGTDIKYFQTIRHRLIDTCLQRNPMHPFWDVSTYVKNFERGLKKSWDRYLSGKPNEHIYIKEDKQDSPNSVESSGAEEL